MRVAPRYANVLLSVLPLPLLMMGAFTVATCQGRESPTADAPATPLATAPQAVPTTAPAPVALLPSGPSLFDLETQLEDQSGHRFTLRDLAKGGRPFLIAMFYARCTYACPTLIADLQRIDGALDAETRARTSVVLVTLVPDLDDPATLADLARRHHLDTTRWRLARAPDDDATRDLANALGVKYTRLPDGNVNHTSAVTLVDATGVPRARLEGLRQDARDFIARISK